MPEWMQYAGFSFSFIGFIILAITMSEDKKEKLRYANYKFLKYQWRILLGFGLLCFFFFIFSSEILMLVDTFMYSLIFLIVSGQSYKSYKNRDGKIDFVELKNTVM